MFENNIYKSMQIVGRMKDLFEIRIIYFQIRKKIFKFLYFLTALPANSPDVYRIEF